MSEKFELPDFNEATVSQIPALLELVNLGYTYLSREEINRMREGQSQYILRDIAFEALREMNSLDISDKSIRDAVFEAESQIDLGAGMIRASEKVYSLLLAGRAVSELIDGRRVSPQLRFVDWRNWEKNSFHVCVEFEVSEGGDSLLSAQRRRLDIVLFVNGIPFAVIENKRESVKVAEAVNQMVRNQSSAGIPTFFLFPQLLIATNGRELKYGTMLTPPKFYTHWKEKDADPEAFDAKVSVVINQPADQTVLQQIAKDLPRPDCGQIETSEVIIHHSSFNTTRAVTEQDRGIYSLLRPERMLDLVRNFILYDGGVKKVARYPQFFAIKKTMAQLKTFDEMGRRRGGLIWHTQGSGKSLTMVMLVKCLIDDPEIVLPRILVVTDRRDLDRQISNTFSACNIKKNVIKTRSGKELLRLVREKDQNVITTLVHKFEAAKSARDFVDEDPNVFVLIDEAHRTQAGKANTELNLILPKACQIAFTGTPLMKKERSTEGKFGGMIDAYTISEAEADEVVLPLIYQPRFVELSVQQDLLDQFYDQVTEPLTTKQKEDLQKKFNSSQIIEETSQRIETIALDIVNHYKPFKDTGLKAQVVAPSKYAAVMFQKAFTLCGVLHTEVIVSESNDKAEDDQLPEHKQVVAEFLTKEKHKYGSSLIAREKKIVDDFKDNPDGVKILIVVDKLLTGFDAPRNTFLYLAKQLKDHNLLQAIARVNRLFDGDEGKEAKVNGFVIDYSMNAKNLRDAMQLFSKYSPEDIERALLNTNEKIQELETVYQTLHSLFNSVRNKQDAEEYIQILEADVEKREHFYELVNTFIKQFSSCQMLHDFTQKFDVQKLRRYQKDLKQFVELKKIQKTLNAETVDFSKYEDQIRRILDKYVSAKYVQEMAEPICISESAEFNAYIENTKGLSNKSKAEAIAAYTKKTIHENFHKDPEFYKRFSEKINKIITALKVAKEEDAKVLLEEVREVQHHVIEYEDNDIPSSLKEYKEQHTYFRNLKAKLAEQPLSEKQLAAMTKAMATIIEKHKIVDWHQNVEVERQVRNELEDYIFDVLKEEYGATLSIDEIDELISMVWKLAIGNVE